jgi:hypothetical protein
MGEQGSSKWSRTGQKYPKGEEMKNILATLLGVLFSSLLLAQNAPSPPVQRQVQGQTLVSKELPAAQFTFSESYRYVGGQVISLYGNAEAEQHVFVRAGETGPVQSFYWVQFEHFLPTNKMAYDYKHERTANIGDFPFIYDVKSFRDYAYMQNEDPHSDGAAISRLLAEHHIAFPKKAARVRMFYLPTSDHRTELMILYGEALPENSKVPLKSSRDEGVLLDDAAPQAAKDVLDRALQGLALRKL